MFADVTARETGRRAALRAAWLLGSTVVQGTLVLATAAASLWLRPAVSDEPLPPIGTPVILRPPPRPPAPAPRPAATARTPPRPPSSTLVQPREVSEVAVLDLSPPEPVPAGSGEPDGAFVPGTAPAPYEEEAGYVRAGFRAPAMAVQHCVQRSVRIPRDLAGFVSGPVTVRFAVGRDGAPGRFSVMSAGVPERLASAIRQAVQECRWVAGADPDGRPIALWVIMPLRFQAE